MLKIRKAQMTRFEKRTEHRLLKMMQEAYPEVCTRLERIGTNDRIYAGIEWAEGQGFTVTDEQERIVHLLFLTDRDQLDQDWATDILAWQEPNDLRLAALERSAQLEAEGKL